MTRDEVITRLCVLSNKVGEHISTMERSFARDCFCRERNKNDFSFQFENEVMEFIEDSVLHRVKEEGRGR